jgi:hypothetical protein
MYGQPIAVIATGKGARQAMTSILRTAGAVALGALLAVPAYAAVDATFVLRSGERVSGVLVDFSASGVTARVGGGTRTYQLGDLAVIDFTNASTYPPNEVDRVNGGAHVLVLRNGSLVTGRLSDVGGANPLRISFVEGGATRDFRSNEVARIYFARPSGSGGGSAGLQAGTGQIRVPGNSDWVPTGLSVRQGQRVELRVSGEVRLSSDPSDIAKPTGSVKGRYEAGAPIPNALAGALIGRVGNGQPFGIGDQSSFPAPATGLLFLRVNDDYIRDNTGGFAVDLYRR